MPLAESGKLYNIFDLMDQNEEIDREDSPHLPTGILPRIKLTG